MYFQTVDIVIDEDNTLGAQTVGQLDIAWVETDLLKFVVMKPVKEHPIDIALNAKQVFLALIEAYPMTDTKQSTRIATVKNTRFVVDTGDSNIAFRFREHYFECENGSPIGITIKFMSPSMVDGVMQHHLIVN